MPEVNSQQMNPFLHDMKARFMINEVGNLPKCTIDLPSIFAKQTMGTDCYSTKSDGKLTSKENERCKEER